MIFGLVAFHCSLTMSYGALMPEFAKEVMHGGDVEFNALNLAIGAGALTGTLIVSTVGRPGLRGSLFLATGLGSGLFPLLLALTENIGAGAAAAIGVGASQAVFMALSTTLLQAVVPDGMRGRVMSLYTMLAAGVMALMNLANGFLADPLGTPVLLAIPGIGFAAIVVAWSLLRADLRRVYRTGVLAESHVTA
jgi:MFS family permease